MFLLQVPVASLLMPVNHIKLNSLANIGENGWVPCP